MGQPLTFIFVFRKLMDFFVTVPLSFSARPVKFGVEGVEILFIEPIGQQPQVLAEALVVHHLALTQEADRVLHVIVVRQTQDVVIRRARLLL